MTPSQPPFQPELAGDFEPIELANEVLTTYPCGRYAEFRAHPAKVSVVIPVYNAEARLQRCLESVAEQSVQDYHVIMVDNCSTDGSFGMACRFAAEHPRFLVCQNPSNLGRVPNWNRALELAPGQYVKPLMANDFLLPDCLKELSAVLDEQPNVALARASVTLLENGRQQFYPLFDSTRCLTSLSAIEFSLTTGNPAAGPSAQMWRRAPIAEHHLRFDTAFQFAADFDFAVRLFAWGDFYYVRQSLYVFELTTPRFATQTTPVMEFRELLDIIGGTVSRHHHQLSPEVLARSRAKAEALHDEYLPKCVSPQDYDTCESLWQQAQTRYPVLFAASLADEQPVTATGDAAAPAPMPGAPTLDDLLRKAEVFTANRDWTEALKVLQDALALAPQDAVILESLGNVCFLAGDFSDALNYFERVASLRPDSADTWLRVAHAAHRLQRTAGFEEAMSRALALEPEHRETLKFLGDLNLQSGAYTDALEVYGRLLRKAPRDVEVLLSLGVCYYKTNQLSHARATYEFVLLIEPGNPLAAENLSLLNHQTSARKNGAQTTAKPAPPAANGNANGGGFPRQAGPGGDAPTPAPLNARSFTMNLPLPQNSRTPSNGQAHFELETVPQSPRLAPGATNGAKSFAAAVVHRVRRHAVAPDREHRWQAAVGEEVAFWDNWCRTRGGQWKDDFETRLRSDTNLETHVIQGLRIPPGGTLGLLDVGAGPLTSLGKRWPGRTVNITAVDPLAEHYESLLLRYGLTPPVRTVRGSAETLVGAFPLNHFDVVHARNSIDHSFDAPKAVDQMLAVAKPGGWVVLGHAISEAVEESNHGLHTWNFYVQNGDFIVEKSGGGQVNITRRYAGIAQVTCEAVIERRWLVVRMHKLVSSVLEETATTPCEPETPAEKFLTGGDLAYLLSCLKTAQEGFTQTERAMLESTQGMARTREALDRLERALARRSQPGPGSQALAAKVAVAPEASQLANVRSLAPS